MVVGDYPLIGKIVVVTGGGSGLCFEFVKLAVAQGNNVIIADIALRPEAEEFINSAEGREHVIFSPCDVAVWEDMEKLVPLAEEKFGDVPDAWVAGAGIFEKPALSFFEDNEKDRFKIMDINASHPIKLTRIAMRASMRKDKKCVVCIVASMAGLYPLYPSPVYNASKHAVIGFVKCMKPADVEENIKIVAVCPGLVATPLWTDDIKDTWSYDQSVALTGLEVAESVMMLVQEGKYEGGTVMTQTSYAGRNVEQFVDIEALFAPLKEKSYTPVRACLAKDRGASKAAMSNVETSAPDEQATGLSDQVPVSNGEVHGSNDQIPVSNGEVHGSNDHIPVSNGEVHGSNDHVSAWDDQVPVSNGFSPFASGSAQPITV